LPLRFVDDLRRIAKLSIVAPLLAPGYPVFALENGRERHSDSVIGLDVDRSLRELGRWNAELVAALQ